MTATAWTTETGQVTTHCTISAGPGEPQTAITFRCGDWGADLLVVVRPFPDSGKASWDYADSVRFI